MAFQMRSQSELGGYWKSKEKQGLRSEPDHWYQGIETERDELDGEFPPLCASYGW